MLVNGLKSRIWRFFHKLRCIKYRKRFNNPDVSIISVNCTGGILYHDLGLQFKSPTVNLFMKAEDFIKFCENLDYYLGIDDFHLCTDESIIEDRNYPIAKLDDLYLYLVHYKSLEEAQEKWNQRKKRIKRDNIKIICCDREGMTLELMNRFENLPFSKILFTHKPHSERNNEFFYIKGYEHDNQVGIITDPEGWTGLRPIDKFNWIKFLNI